MDYTSKDFYVPTINFFESGNILTGSCNGMNYKVTPKSNDEGKLLRVQLWYGPMNLEHSDLVAQQEFAQSKESVQQVESWLREQYEIYLKTKGASDYLKKKKKHSKKKLIVWSKSSAKHLAMTNWK